ncbi:hypothetical protein EIP91_006705 [Steccherinum ochraceum]|uniref:PUB domain-containing protein n=1 Tax=Steccherinum ochraceum TaxID=92696 RepID=A0A4R0RZ36_9APHY|nr:hypothetical protein EIP91_006705 [Steccherinum ochraceum]
MDTTEDNTNATIAVTATNPVTPPTAPSATSLADAIERRLHQQREESTAHSSRYSAFDQDHEKRQEFRRLIEPGILRRNPKHITTEALRILVKLSDNIIEHPDDTKYYKFKPTNEKIKTYLVDPKGTLEYAVALGFRPEVENFQPFYVFQKRFLNDLKIGNAIIREMLEIEDAKQLQQEKARAEEKAAREAVKDKVKQAFMDDRKSTASRLEREAIAREAKGSLKPTSPPPARATRAARIPGSGQTLTGEVVPETPPPHSGHHTADDEDAEEDDEDEE